MIRWLKGKEMKILGFGSLPPLNEEPRRWFAWHPVQLYRGTAFTFDKDGWVWLQWVERRYHCDGYVGSYWYYTEPRKTKTSEAAATSPR